MTCMLVQSRVVASRTNLTWIWSSMPPPISKLRSIRIISMSPHLKRDSHNRGNHQVNQRNRIVAASQRSNWLLISQVYSPPRNHCRVWMWTMPVTLNWSSLCSTSKGMSVVTNPMRCLIPNHLRNKASMLTWILLVVMHHRCSKQAI